MLGRSTTIPTEQTQKLFGVNLRSDSNLKLISVLHDFYLREYKQNTENIDDFVARYRLEVKKYKFRDTRKLKNGT